jgi:hypothetical protein
MKQGIPKSVQDLLARQTAADDHPSADLLNGYMEQLLTASEMAQVTNHLAACGECREIVFLASGVQEEEVVPAVAAAMPAQERQVVAPAGRRKSGWVWWKWAAPAVAVIAIAGGVLIEQNRIPERAHPAAETLALNYPAQSTATGNEKNAVILNPPVEPAAKAKQVAPTESKKHAAAEARRNENVEQAGLIEQQQALQRARELAQLSSALEKTRPNAAGRALAAMPAAPRANPAPSLVSGDFSGIVTDPSGAIVANATVTLKNNGTGQTRSTTSNNNGAYRFSLLPPGSYTVSATASGFSKVETTAMISVGHATVADVKLAVGSSSQTVEVTSAAPLIQADNADLSTNFDQNVVRNAPNGGSDLTHAPKTAPGVNSAAGGKDQTGATASLKSGLVSSGQPAAMNKPAKAALPPAHWRISADGHLERALPGTAWTRVLADQPVAFRVVATIGSNVWAGGNGGALFHSTDQGQSWNRIALNMNGQAERSAVVSIHFDNAMQGSVATDSGVTWTTSDGGQTWIKR